MSDKSYNFLKYFVSIAMPAILGLWMVASEVFGFTEVPFFTTTLADGVTKLWTGAEICLASLFGITVATYKGEK